MRTIELLDEAPSINDVLKLAGKENIILRSLDGREFVLAEIDTSPMLPAFAGMTIFCRATIHNKKS